LIREGVDELILEDIEIVRKLFTGIQSNRLSAFWQNVPPNL